MKRIKVQDISSPAMKQWVSENKELIPFVQPPQYLIDEANERAKAREIISKHIDKRNNFR